MKVTVKFPHTHAGQEYPAGSTIDLPDVNARWLLAQKIDDQPCAVACADSAVETKSKEKA